MAFQAGTKVDPRLMQADYSGFANAASIRANALANLGQQIGEGIEKYQKKKEDKANEDGMVDFLVQTGAFGNATPEATAVESTTNATDVVKDTTSVK